LKAAEKVCRWSDGRPRLLAVIPVAFIVGLVPPFCFAWNTEFRRSLVFWSGLTGTTAIILAASLLVVRSAGWRLCSAAEEQRASPSETDL
jgi:hypothetical protein